MPDLSDPQATTTQKAAKPRNPTPSRPLPEDIVDNGLRYPQCLRAQALTLAQVGMNSVQIGRWINVPADTIRYWIRFAKGKGWEVNTPEGDSRRILTVHVEAGRSSGRPAEVGEEVRTETAISQR